MTESPKANTSALTNDAWSAVIQTAAAALAAMPGIATLVSGLTVPSDLKIIFGALYTIVGTIVIMLLWSSRRSLLSKSPAALRKHVIAGVLIGLCAFGVYQYLYRQAVFVLTDSRGQVPREIEYRFPLIQPAEFDSLFDRYGSRAEAIVEYHPERMLERLQEPDIALRLGLTDLVLLITYLLVAVPLAWSLGVAALMTQQQPAP